MATLKDIASKAGVSTCTASRILSGRGRERYSDACRRRVEAAAKALRFAPNQAARSLRTGASGIVAFSADWAHLSGSAAFGGAMIAACEAAAWRHGLHLLIVGPRGGRTAAMTARDLLRQRHCDGVVVSDGDFVGKDAASLRGARVAFLDRPPAGFGGGDLLDGAGIEAAVRHLASMGHRKVAWFGIGETHRSDARQSAFAGACAGKGLDARMLNMPPSDVRDDQGHVDQARSALLARRAEIADRTALVCYSDLLAIGAIAALGALGRRVPHEVSVVGFDNVHAATALPALTTVDHELEELADAAFTALSDGGSRRQIPSRLVLRASTAPAPVT